MAVPKKKRYKQVVNYRRSLQKTNILLKKNISLTKYNNYADNFPQNWWDHPYCKFCNNKQLKNSMCESCYDQCFSLVFTRNKILIKKEKNRDLVREYYVKLSKALFPPSGS